MSILADDAPEQPTSPPSAARMRIATKAFIDFLLVAFWYGCLDVVNNDYHRAAFGI
jgi:hypothetical protein